MISITDCIGLIRCLHEAREKECDMTIPTFTAEASLNKAILNYQYVPQPSAGNTSQIVSPAACCITSGGCTDIDLPFWLAWAPCSALGLVQGGATLVPSPCSSTSGCPPPPPPPPPPPTCRTLTGKCTGFGSMQCVSDAPLSAQCCSGWFQYPWITVCSDGTRSQGCGICAW